MRCHHIITKYAELGRASAGTCAVECLVWLLVSFDMEQAGDEAYFTYAGESPGTDEGGSFVPRIILNREKVGDLVD